MSGGIRKRQKQIALGSESHGQPNNWQYCGKKKRTYGKERTVFTQPKVSRLGLQCEAKIRHLCQDKHKSQITPPLTFCIHEN